MPVSARHGSVPRHLLHRGNNERLLAASRPQMQINVMPWLNSRLGPGAGQFAFAGSPEPTIPRTAARPPRPFGGPLDLQCNPVSEERGATRRPEPLSPASMKRSTRPAPSFSIGASSLSRGGNSSSVAAIGTGFPAFTPRTGLQSTLQMASLIRGPLSIQRGRCRERRRSQEGDRLGVGQRISRRRRTDFGMVATSSQFPRHGFRPIERTSRPRDAAQ